MYWLPCQSPSARERGREGGAGETAERKGWRGAVEQPSLAQDAAGVGGLGARELVLRCSEGARFFRQRACVVDRTVNCLDY